MREPISMWMYRKLGVDRGPIDDKKMISLLKANTVKGSTLVQHPRFTDGGWAKAIDVPVLAKVMQRLESRQQAIEPPTPKSAEPPAAPEPPIPVLTPTPVVDEWVEIEAPAPPADDPYETNQVVYSPDYTPTNVDTQFLLDHGSSLISLGFVLSIALFLLLGVLPLIAVIFIGLKNGDLDPVNVGTMAIGAAVVGLMCYILYYWLRLMGSLFRVFAHIESNTRRASQ